MPVGQLADWRLPHPNCHGLHVREYPGYYTAHVDKVNPRCDLPGHLTVDAPLVGGGAALGALVGLLVGESASSMLIGAIIGGALGAAAASASAQETVACGGATSSRPRHSWQIVLTDCAPSQASHVQAREFPSWFGLTILAQRLLNLSAAGELARIALQKAKGRMRLDLLRACAISFTVLGCTNNPADQSSAAQTETTRQARDNASFSKTLRDVSAGARGISARELAASLETVAVSRGVPLDVTVLSVDSADGRVTLTRNDFAEVVQGDADRAEQSWHFDLPPGGAGELTIEITTAGLGYLDTTSDGVLLRAAGNIGVRYGHGTWVDANGYRTSVAARHANGRILLTVPAAVVSGSAFPAVLDPIIIVTPNDTPP